ncbi:MAG: double-strand break repair protein AddB, partial [Hyphomicrobiales bacterium]
MTRRTAEPTVYSVPPGTPFLRALARAVLDGGLPHPGTSPPDPVSLIGYRIMVPTRRAARALIDVFLEASGEGAQLLPRITPLGDVDEDELMLGGGPDPQELDIGPAIAPLQRRLLLTRFILDWARSQEPAARTASIQTPAQAALLAADLARLIDMFETEQADWSALEDLVDSEFSAHWQASLSFLDLLRVSLPRELERLELMNPMARRNLLLAAEARRLEADGCATPIIAAGSTGSIPATADLLGVIAGLPGGALVLPGLDMTLDDAAWAGIGPEHPHYGMKQLLDRMGITREGVRPLPGTGSGPQRAVRVRFLSEVMRPAEATDRWAEAVHAFAPEDLAPALDGMRVITAPTRRDEALSIALIMRRTLDEPGRTAALVTPDRSLARRVAAELARWHLEVDDSAGTPLAATPEGTFALLLVDAVAGGLSAVPLLALLKHPLAAFGLAPAEVRRLAGLLEIAALRGPAPPQGIDGLRRVIAGRAEGERGPMMRPHPAVERIAPEDWAALGAFLERLEAVLDPLAALYDGAGIEAPGDLIRAHLKAAEAACALPGEAEDTASNLWQGDAGEALAGFFSGLLEGESQVPLSDPQDYGPFLSSLMSGMLVRPRFGRHPRLSIWGLLEARLMQADVVILGGLNEGIWPPQAMTDAWLNRPMRSGIGLEPPERRIGLTAHDFAQATAAGRVYLTHAEKIDGTPVVPSRWLLRLRALLSGMAGAGDGMADAQWVSWSLGIDHTDAYKPIARPEPRPPVAVRPRRMSVTRVEEWIRDPYATFARAILRLEPLAALAADPAAAERGSIIHDVLHRFVRDGHPVTLDGLLGVGREVFRAYLDYPDVDAFWWPRFERAARWLIDQDLFDDRDIAKRLTEVSGEIVIDGPAGPFRLNARADRIDISPAGGATIIDYKTGQAPSEKQMASGLAPQLPLEAAIAAEGGFKNAGKVTADRLVFIRLSGGEPAGEVREPGKHGAMELAGDALDGLIRRIAAFDSEETP